MGSLPRWPLRLAILLILILILIGLASWNRPPAPKRLRLEANREVSLPWRAAANRLLKPVTEKPREGQASAGKKAKNHDQERDHETEADRITDSKASDGLFGGLEVLSIRIDIPEEGMDRLRGYFWQQGSEARPEVLATVREGGKTYQNVALHLKGAAGSFRPVDANPALTLSFDKHEPDQRFRGLKKISLNNSVQDPSFLSEKLCRELFLEAGVPVPRAAHARVILNGRDLGLYVLVEGFNKQFLRRHFENVFGNLYDGGFVQDVSDRLSVNCGDQPDDRTEVGQLLEAAQEPDSARRLDRLEKILDMDRFLAFIAMESMLCHWDGYAMNRNNYRLYHDLDSGRMVFFPHGLDQMFGVSRSSPTQPIVPRAQGLIAQAVLQTLDGRRRYLEKFSQLHAAVFKPDRLLKRVGELAAALRPALSRSGAHAARFFDYEVGRLRERIAQRARSIEEQLAAPSRILRFDGAGAASLGGWRPKSDSGGAELSKAKDPEGRLVLMISAPAGRNIASWRARAILPAGRYRFEGKVKCKGVAANDSDPRSGAALRISGRAAARKLSGDRDWTDFSYPFEVGGECTEVELVCELNAARGEAWFDADSLKLVRE